jgi:hypothetical protein
MKPSRIFIALLLSVSMAFGASVQDIQTLDGAQRNKLEQVIVGITNGSTFTSLTISGVLTVGGVQSNASDIVCGGNISAGGFISPNRIDSRTTVLINASSQTNANWGTRQLYNGWTNNGDLFIVGGNVNAGGGAVTNGYFYGDGAGLTNLTGVSGGGAATNAANVWVEQQSYTNAGTINFQGLSTIGFMQQDGTRLFNLAQNNMSVGNSALPFTNLTASTTNNLVIGISAFRDGTNTCYENLVIGDGAFWKYGGSANVGVTQACQNVVIGHHAGANSANSVMQRIKNCVIIGYKAGLDMNSASAQSTIIGDSAGNSVATRMTAIGYSAGNSSTGGDMTIVGMTAGNNISAGNNTVIGANAGNFGSPRALESCTLLGGNAGKVSLAATNSTAIGWGSYFTKNNTLVLGSNNVTATCVATNEANGVAKLTVPGPVSLGQTGDIISNMWARTFELTAETIPVSSSTNWIVTVTGCKPSDAATPHIYSTNWVDGIVWTAISSNDTVLVNAFNPSATVTKTTIPGTARVGVKTY